MIRSCSHESRLWPMEYMKKLDKELRTKIEKEGVIFTNPDRSALEKASQPTYEAIYSV